MKAYLLSTGLLGSDIICRSLSRGQHTTKSMGPIDWS